MTAASGLVHEERHGREFAKTGGRFEMVQLWVNLPKKDKMTQPRYQGLRSADIPRVQLPQAAGMLRVIAGRYQEAIGPAKTFSPINLWDVRLKAGAEVKLQVPSGHTAVAFVLRGRVSVSGGKPLGDAELAVLDPEGDTFALSASQDTTLLFLGGEPLNEPIVGHGPFVMNTQGEILQAMMDFNAGKMGTLGAIEGSEHEGV
jgi:redox-sensitive bicupin YhaK (pirin superfamily)